MLTNTLRVGFFPLNFSNHCPVVSVSDVKMHTSKRHVITKRNFSEQAFLHDLYIDYILAVSECDLALRFFVMSSILL